jgi:4-hydroxy-3-methylbut-2-enyl diphosphate reductase
MAVIKGLPLTYDTDLQEAKEALFDVVDLTAESLPVLAGLVKDLAHPGGNITGVSDMLPLDQHMKMVKKFIPNLKALGVVYNSGEANSKSSVKLLKSVGKDMGYEVVDATVSKTSEVYQASKSLVGQVDAVVVVGGYHSGNTKRLVQISEEAGLPTFHVETEKDLDKQRLSSMEVIGVTAGASTPNWMIKNVVKEIEAIRTRRETFFGRWIKIAFKFMLLSNLLVAFGGFALAYAAAVLSGRTPDLIHPCIALLYIYAMHVLNRFLDKGASTYNDPERASFYRRYRVFLILSGVFSMIGALGLSYYLGTMVFLAIAGLSVLGIIYSLPIVPVSLRHLWRYSKIKDIPGSKTLSVALAWGVLISLLPLLEPTSLAWPAVIVSFFFVFSMVYVRSALFDIFQVQGDLIVGVETLPIVLGEKRTLHLLKWIILSGALVLCLAALAKLVGPFSWLLLLVFLSFTLCLLIYQKRWLYPGTRLEAMVEGNFFLAGLLALIWQIFS